jgi:hypothetical protein
MNIVCGSILVDDKIHNFWTNGEETLEIRIFINDLMQKGYVFVAFAAEAEASSLLSLGVNPLGTKWVDLQLEVKMLYNHNYALSTGEHLVRGRKVHIKPFGEKPQTNLASSLFKFCKIVIDTDHKTAMRDIIISKDNDMIEQNKQSIMNYCASDVKYLPSLFRSIMGHYDKLVLHSNKPTLQAEIMNRGESSARVAMMTRHGYPVEVTKAENLAANVPVILFDCAKDINSQFDINPFKFNAKTCSFTMDTKVLRTWIVGQKFPAWELTDTGMPSLSLESWEKYFPFRHEFPRGNLGAQILRYLKIQQSVRSFNIKSGSQSKTFFDYIGSDGMCRPFLNGFGAQSSRFQPASTGYLFLKPAFLRSLCEPPSGYLMGSIDYSSQEFLLAALLSGDDKMLEAYLNGDVYLYFAVQSKMVPSNATKESHKKERDLAKSTVLGISYSMTCVGLSRKLTSDTGSLVTEEKAQEYIDDFNTVFSKFYQWKLRQLEEYKARGHIRLPDGWYMWGNNPNDRSVTNMRIQGMGGCILRKAIALAQDDGVNVVAPLHDAAYIMFPKEDKSAMDILAKAMIDAFCFYFEGDKKIKASAIRLEAEVWGRDIDLDAKYTTFPMPITSERIHIDPRGKKEYEQFKQYWEHSEDLGLL